MKHKVIIVPGLSDNDKGIKVATRHWKNYGLKVIVFPVGWKTDEGFNNKSDRLIELIDGFIKEGNKISLAGTSAGGSLVLNVFLKRKDKISKVVNICGRLRKGDQKGLRGFEVRTSSSKSFRDSVLMFEQEENLLTKNNRKRVMTVTAKFGDELVPYGTAILPGALNLQVPTFEHLLGIGFALNFFKPVISFLASQFGVS